MVNDSIAPGWDTEAYAAKDTLLWMAGLRQSRARSRRQRSLNGEAGRPSGPPASHSFTKEAFATYLNRFLTCPQLACAVGDGPQSRMIESR